MGVLVGVQVSGVTTEEPAENLQLGPALGLDRGLVLGRAALIGHHPFAFLVVPPTEVDVEADGQRGMIAGVAGGLGARALAHHQTGAGHDASLVGRGDAGVGGLGEAEVIGVDDQHPLIVHQRPRLSASASASPSQSWRCPSGGIQLAGPQPSH